MTQRGRFVTLEGGEGAGKSTQARRLAQVLQATGLGVVLTREPGGSAHAEAIRAMLLEGLVAPFGAEAEAMFFAVARADHVARTIRPALRQGSWVICDRFFDSTRAYQGTAGVHIQTLAALERIAVGDCRPDLTLILDVPADRGLARAGGRSAGPDRFEADTLAVHEARRGAFLAIAAAEPERCALVDGMRTEDEVAAAILQAVQMRLGPLAARA